MDTYDDPVIIGAHGQAHISSAGLTAERQLILPDASGELALVQTPQLLTRSGCAQFCSGKSNNEPATSVFVGQIEAYAYVSNKIESVGMIYQVCDEHAPGTPLSLFVRWAPEDAGAGVVRWGIEYVYANDGGLFTGATVYLEQAAPGVARQHRRVDMAGGFGAGFVQAGTLLLLRLFRDTANAADTYAGDAFGLMCGINYQVLQ